MGMFDDLIPQATASATAPTGGNMFADLIPQVASPSVGEGVMRSAAEGVPVLGGLANKLDAATDATLAPLLNPLFDEKDQLNGAWADRYNQALAVQEGQDRAFAGEHPVLQKGAELAGGVGGMAAAGSTALGAKLLGLTGGGFIPRTIASGASGAAINSADAAIRGNDPTTGAEVGGLTGLAGPLVGRAVGGLVNAVRPAVKAAALPTSQELIDSAGAAYHAPELKAVEFQPTAVNDLSDSMAADLNGKRINERLAPQTHAIIQDLKTPVNGQYFTMEDLTTARQLLGDIAGNISNKTDATGAVRAKQMIDKYLANVPSIDVTAGDANVAGQILKNANADYAAGKTAQALEGKIDAADLQAASANSGANYENALRQRIRSILTSPTQRRGFSPDEITAMQSIVRGTAPQNVLRVVGNLLGGGGGLGALASGSVAAMAGAGPLAVLAPATGFAIKKIGNAIMDSRANALDEMIRSRAPTAAPALAQRVAAAAANRARLAQMQNAGAIASRGVNPALSPAYQ